VRNKSSKPFFFFSGLNFNKETELGSPVDLVLSSSVKSIPSTTQALFSNSKSFCKAANMLSIPTISAPLLSAANSRLRLYHRTIKTPIILMIAEIISKSIHLKIILIKDPAPSSLLLSSSLSQKRAKNNKAQNR